MKLIQQEDYKYVWTLSKKSWYVKLYLWVWRADPEEITFCKLWWAYVLMLPIGLPMRILSYPLRAVGFVFRRLAVAIRGELGREVAVTYPAPLKPARKTKKAKTHKPARMPYMRVPVHPAAGRKAEFSAAHSIDHEYVHWTFGDEEEREEIPEEPAGRYAHYHNLLFSGGCTSYGDGSIKHRYAQPGEYEVTMEAQDKDLNRHVIKKTVTVYAKPRASIRVLEGAEFGAAKFINGIFDAAYGVSKVTKPVRKPVKVAATTVAKPIGQGAGTLAYLGFRSFRRVLVSLTLFYTALVTAAVIFTHTNVAPAHDWHAIQHPGENIWLGLGAGFTFMLVCLFTVFLLFWAEIPQTVAPAVGQGVARGSVGFWEAMRVGYKAVKTNTCPRVEVTEEEST